MRRNLKNDQWLRRCCRRCGLDDRLVVLVEQLGLRSERYHGAARQVAQQTEERSARKLDLLQRAVGLGKDIPDLFEEEDHGDRLWDCFFRAMSKVSCPDNRKQREFGCDEKF